MSFVCFFQAAEYGVADLFMPGRLRASTESGLFRANEGVFLPLSSDLRTDVLKRGLLCFISDCTIDPASAIIAFERAGEMEWAAPDWVGWLLYNFKDTAFISVPEWQRKQLKRGLRGYCVHGVAHAKMAPRYVEEFSDAGISR